MANEYQYLGVQYAAKLEATPGTVETLAAADVNLRAYETSNFEPQFDRFPNQETSDDIAKSADFVSGAKGQLSFGTTFKGSGVLGTEPAIGIYLEACGLKKYMVKTITIGAITGGPAQFYGGAAYSAASGTKTGLIDVDISGAGTLRFIPLVGGDLAAADVVTSGGASATASGTVATYAVKYGPVSVGQKTLTIQRGMKNVDAVAGKDRLWLCRGCAGTASIELAALDAAKFQGEFSGVLHSFGEGNVFSGVDYESIVAANLPKLINSPMQLNAVALCPSAVTIALGNNVLLSPSPCQDGGAAGYTRARIRNRAPQVTIDPYALPPTVLNESNLLQVGTEIPFTMTWGTSPNLIEFTAAKVQVSGVSYSERDGRLVAQLTLDVVRNAQVDNDYAFYFR